MKLLGQRLCIFKDFDTLTNHLVETGDLFPCISTQVLSAVHFKMLSVIFFKKPMLFPFRICLLYTLDCKSSLHSKPIYPLLPM